MSKTTDTEKSEDLPLIDLEAKLATLNSKIAEFTQFSPSDVDAYLDLIHQYNDMKDTGQELIGTLARLEGKSTKSLYEELGIDFDS